MPGAESPDGQQKRAGPTHVSETRPIQEASTDQIDRNAYEPVYIQLANLLRRRIITDGLLAGEQLPSEAAICKSYDVSPMTVRRAISLLVQQGVVSTERGRGTYVKKIDLGAATFGIDAIHRLYRNASRVEVRILEVRLVPADCEIARHLAIAEGERTIHLRRLLVADGEPIFYHYEYLVCDIHSPIVEAELEATSCTACSRERATTFSNAVT
jgi:GntR family transcriptional regulator